MGFEPTIPEAVHASVRMATVIRWIALQLHVIIGGVYEE
jgi:hypothetical protein